MPTSLANPSSLSWLKCLHLLQTLDLFLGSSASTSCKPLISFLAQVLTCLANPCSLSWLKCLHLLQTHDFFLGSSAYISCKPLISFLAEVHASLASPRSLSWLKCLHLLQLLGFFLGSNAYMLQAPDPFLVPSACISCKPLVSSLAQVPTSLANP